tara:strand:- start:178 stop:1872 length:1695 start_codon:yes stop_codon:yes gene_type:complete
MANLRVNEITTGVGSYNGSIYATGTSSYLFTTVTAPGTDDFTIECYINTDQASGSNQDGIFAINASTGGFQSNTNNQIRLALGRAGGSGQNGGLEVNINGTAVDCGSNDIIQEGTWHHVAVTRASGTVKIWVDGVEKASGSAAGDVTGTSFVTGYYDGLYTYQGFLSNFRYRKGTAHYTTTFTAPTKPLERTSDTELIFAQSPHNPSDGFSSAIQGGTTDIMQVNGNVTANESSPTQLSDTSAVGVVYDGPIKHNTQGYMYFPTGRTEERGGGRAVFGGGANPSITSVIDYVHVPTDGNAIKFGDLSGQTNSIMAVSSQTRGIWGGGNPGPGATNAMEFVTLATTSNTTDFGDLTVARMHGGAVQNSTRGVFMTGYTPSNVNTIDFITMATTGDATDFGDVIDDGWPCGGGRSSSTRGVLMGHGDGTNRIQFITIMTTGNSQDFGDLNTNSYGVGAGELSDGLRGIAMGGSGNPGDHTNVIDFITIATTGNATEFGDLTVSRRGGGVGCTLIKGICAGGRNPSDVNIIDSVIIQTTGNATDFGDISEARAFQPAGCSDSHGGLT